MVRKRVVTSKPTRNGCLTCRIRKIKCDQAEPYCLKCTSTGRQCDGYPCKLPSVPKNGCPLRPIIPSTHNGNSLPLRKGPNVLSHLSHLQMTEIQALDYFRLEVANHMMHILPAPEWIQLALQFSLRETSVLHAIIAFSAMIQAQNRVLFDMSLRKIRCTDHRFPMQQYNKAIAILRNHITSATECKATVEPVLVSCLLFVSFEVLYGDSTTAMIHLQLGQGIMEQCRESQDMSMLTPPSKLKIDCSIALNHLIGTFGRLQRNVTTLAASVSHCLRSLHLTITSLEEARAFLGNIVSASDRIRSEMFDLANCQLMNLNTHVQAFDQITRVCATQCFGQSKNLSISAQISRRINKLITAHLAWYRAMEEYGNFHDVAASMQHLFLKIQWFSSHALLLMCKTYEDRASDDVTYGFAQILDMIEQYLSFLAASSPGISENKSQQTYSLEMGVLPALFLIICQSKSEPVQQRALKLLATSDITEGCCHSKIIGNLAEAILSIKEPQVCGPDIAKFLRKHLPVPPEQLRFIDLVVSVQLQHIRIVFGRFISENEDQLELLEYEGTGYPLTLRLKVKHTMLISDNDGTR